MNWIARIGAELGALRGRTGRDLQLRLDTARLYVLSPAAVSKAAPPDVTAAALDDLPPFEEQFRDVSRNMSSAAAEQLLTASTPENCHPSGVRVTPTTDDFDPPPAVAAFSAMTIPAVRRRRSLKARTLSVSVKESSIPGAGLGVFVEGSVDAGALITLYPGLTYRPSDVRHMPDYPNVSKNNEYLMWRYDGVIVDGSAASVSRVVAENGAGAPSADQLSSYAAGQYVNHPPPGGSPNALQYALTLDSRTLPARVHSRLPNRPWRAASAAVPGDGGGKCAATGRGASLEPKLTRRPGQGGLVSRTLHALEDMAIRQRIAGVEVTSSRGRLPSHAAISGLAIVAVRPMEDEEVFINYRFNPASPSLPDWYVDCNPEESRRRWVQEGFWS
jgi:hypothetical protein